MLISLATVKEYTAVKCLLFLMTHFYFGATYQQLSFDKIPISLTARVSSISVYIYTYTTKCVWDIGQKAHLRQCQYAIVVLCS